MSDDIQSRINHLQDEITVLDQRRIDIVTKITQMTREIESLKSEYNLKKSLNLDKDWDNEEFSWDEQVLNILKDVFRIDNFRLKQKAAINLLLSKKDVLVVMPTGGGKSLCYQLPAVLSNGLTVVISPLLALMEDQLIALQKFNISAAMINSAASKEDKARVYQFLNKNEGDLKMIFVTPEWLSNSKKFMSALQKAHKNGNLERFAVDEVHCCSQWGHDFRTDYEFLSMLKHLFPELPIIGLTATASHSVLLDVQKMLNIEGCPMLTAPFDRKNLNFIVVQKNDESVECMRYLHNLIKNKYKDMSGIIYTVTINDAHSVASGLKNLGVKVYYYHAEMEKDVRAKIHKKWLANELQVIVATIAFGMGIDKPDVKFVIHYSIPKSLEALYQEAGRAGRNGENADCIVMFRVADYMKQSAYAKSSTQIENCTYILKYCLNIKDCRHYLLQKHFETEVAEYKCENMCDNCRNPNNIETYDITKAYRQINDILQDTEESLTLKKLLDKWQKFIPSKLKIGRTHLANIVGNLISEGYFMENRSFTSYTVNVYIQRALKSNYRASDSIYANLKKDDGLKVFFKKDQSGPSAKVRKC